MLTKIRNIFNNSRMSKNTAPKVLSLLFAVIFWFYVMNQVNPETIRELQNIPVKLIGVEDVRTQGYEIMDELDFKVDVKIKGRRNEVISVMPEAIEVIADLRDYEKKGSNKFTLMKSIRAENVSIVELSKPEIKINLDRIVEIPKRVNVSVIGQVPKGYIASDLKIQPEDVTVRGPESIVNTVLELVGEVNIGDGTETISKEIPLIAINNDGEAVGVTLKSDYVQVEYGISRRKTMTIEEQSVGKIAEGYKLVDIRISPTVAVVDGAKSIADKFDTLKTSKFSIDGVKKSFKIQVPLELPEGMSTPYISGNVTVDVVVEEIISKEFVFDANDIPTINLPVGYNTNISELNETISVRIHDGASVLDDVKKSDIEIFVNAEELVIGENEVELSINRGAEFESIQIMPSIIKINVTEKTNGNDTEDGNNQEVPDAEIPSAGVEETPEGAQSVDQGNTEGTEGEADLSELENTTNEFIDESIMLDE